MFKNYIKVAYRNLLKNKVFTAANIVGLTLAFAVALLLTMTALFELSYDQFHENKDSVYQVYYTNQIPKGSDISTANPVPFAPALKEEVPGVQQISRALSENALVSYGDNDFNLDAEFVDADYFSIFSFPTLLGDTNKPMPDQNSVSLTEKASKKLFGTTDGVGKTVRILIGKEEKPFTVSSILKNIPDNSSVSFDIAIPFESHWDYKEYTDDWDSQNHPVYLQLADGVSKSQFEESTVAFTLLHKEEQMNNMKRDGAQPDVNGNYSQLNLLPYTDKRFANFNSGVLQIKRTFPYMILGIAFLIIFIACANFVNMNIALGEKRLKEIGMRKTLGAVKGQLFGQFWLESLMVFAIAIVLALILSNLLIGPYKTLFNTDATFQNLMTPVILGSFLLGILIVTLFTGGYPALLLSKLNTLKALKGKWELGKNGVRNALIVVQFVIAIVLITGTLVFQGQLQFMRNKNLGFNKEQVVSIPLNGKKDSYRVIELMRNELRGNNNILSVTGSDNNLGRGRDGSMSISKFGFEHEGRIVNSNVLNVDYDYAKTLDIQLLEGRMFSKDYSADSLSMVINEAMVKELNEEDNPLATRIYFDEDSVAYNVIGVLKDYNHQDISKSIEPLTFFLDKNYDLYYAYIKVAPADMASSFDAIKNAWQKVEPNAEFLGSFIDENIDRTFKKEKSMATIITAGSILGIVLSCIGLFAMSLLVVAQRTKEIGVRKVIGASTSSITILLTKDFLKLVGIAFIIGAPIAWFALDKWLQDYAFRVPLSIWFFVGAGLLAALIALLTVGARTMKAAAANPVKSLRTE
ncbi:FtsX-like permease family protein [Maribacter forsetii]|uniref:FtsX-like permease family protein n=1 Tax=Maribacter forsetii TaxID=444515 RepID=UPI00055B313F|nr:FtsX-like permease family protein [Maribacter forsetii]